ncbi:MAG: hypothetical protein AAFQ07_13235 [Chloroflexota bacterium]
MCRNGTVPPAEHYVAGDNVTLPNTVLSDGNHKYVASRLMNYPLAIVPSPSSFAIIEEDDFDFFQFYEWSEMEWREGN